MHHKNIIFSSLKESFTKIWQNKFLFILLFFLQILFFAVFSMLSYHYQTKITQSSKEIFEYLGRQKLDELSVTENIMQQKNILGEDPLMISRKLDEITKNFRIYLMYTFSMLIVFSSLAWSLTNRIVHKMGIKQIIKCLAKTMVILAFYQGLIFLFLLLLFNISFSQIGNAAGLLARYVPFFIFSIALSYFMFVSVPLLHNTDLKNIAQKTLSVGIKKSHYILSVYFINFILFFISILLLYAFIGKNLLILLLSISLLIFSFVFGRILMANVVHKLEKSQYME